MNLSESNVGAFLASDGLILLFLSPVKSWAKVVLSIVSKNASSLAHLHLPYRMKGAGFTPSPLSVLGLF